MKYNSGCMVCGADLVYSHELMYSQCSICGAGVGSGIFTSVIKWATPLTKYSWVFSNKMKAMFSLQSEKSAVLDVVKEIVSLIL